MRQDIPQPQPKTYGKRQTESPLSPYRASVVQFRREADVACGCLNRQGGICSVRASDAFRLV